MAIIDSIVSLIKFVIFLEVATGVVGIAVGIFVYNKLQQYGQEVKSAHATVLTMIQKRSDLINKIMDVTKSYGEHEKLVHITASNNLAETLKQSAQAMTNLTALAQTYPELKADDNYKQLMVQIQQMEDELQEKREMYNHVSKDYNTARLQIPAVLFAKLLGFNEAPYFEFDNLQDIKEFRTDDGAMLREALASASVKAMSVAKQGAGIVNEQIKKRQSSNDNNG